MRVGEEVDTGAQIRFDSSLIANDVDPTTRLTVSRRMSDQLTVIVSQNLRENDRFGIDKQLENRLLLTVAPDGYLQCLKD